MSPPRQQILASKNIWKAIGAYAVAVALCLIILAWAMKLWDADLRIPFFYGGDAFRDVLQVSTWIKGVIDNGWYQHNSFIGMPAGQDMYDFTITASLDFTIIKLITFFAPNYAMTLNLYFLLTFPLTTLTTMLVLRQLKVSYASSIVGSLLFTFVPYHFLRGEQHLFLSAYYMIPLIVMVILWIYTDKSFLFNADKNNSKLRFGLLNYKSMISIIICILVSSTCIYYAFFSCFLLVIAGVSSSISQKNKYPLLTSGILIAVIIIGGLINASPALIYQHEYGSNPEVAIRGPEEAECYGLKIIQLLMPINGHRIPFMANIADKYCRTAPLVNENKFSSLGIIGSLGFLILIGWVFYRLSGGLNVNVNVNLKLKLKLNNTINELNGLSILNLFAVLLATIGGFGAIFNYAIYSQLRCYNRISIFIAFFSLLAVILLLEIFSQKHIKTKTTRLLFYGFLGLILIVGIMDQSTESYAPPYSATKAEYLNDADFINKIESIMPENAMIFQLPYVPYPENPPVYKMSDYSHFKGYLHSNDLRWSYGAMKGREGDRWQRTVAKVTIVNQIEDMVNILSFTGFNGIYLDSYGYADDGVKVISELSNVLETKTLVSANARLYFFDMTEYNKKRILITPFRTLCDNWHGLESWHNIPTQWASNNTTIYIYSPENRFSNLSFAVLSFYKPRAIQVFLDDELIHKQKIPTSFVEVEVPVKLKEGENILRFWTPDGCQRPIDIQELKNEDSRCLSLAFQNITIG